MSCTGSPPPDVSLCAFSVYDLRQIGPPPCASVFSSVQWACRPLHLFAGAAITKQKRGWVRTMKMHSLSALEAGNPASRCEPEPAELPQTPPGQGSPKEDTLPGRLHTCGHPGAAQSSMSPPTSRSRGCSCSLFQMRVPEAQRGCVRRLRSHGCEAVELGFEAKHAGYRVGVGLV